MSIIQLTTFYSTSLYEVVVLTPSEYASHEGRVINSLYHLATFGFRVMMSIPPPAIRGAIGMWKRSASTQLPRDVALLPQNHTVRIELLVQQLEQPRHLGHIVRPSVLPVQRHASQRPYGLQIHFISCLLEKRVRLGLAREQARRGVLRRDVTAGGTRLV
ncbi:hypothetical protein MVEN_00134600 [Mycena venus]|uniref:Uncharacterized protein n=1 Tax=Mycena venus TaxID=2733690 RepID=A0A8H7DE29_9AGAR|nr:hypothetical protein MVEN_00134600 [Mycena venus]